MQHFSDGNILVMAMDLAVTLMKHLLKTMVKIQRILAMLPFSFFPAGQSHFGNVVFFIEKHPSWSFPSVLSYRECIGVCNVISMP